MVGPIVGTCFCCRVEAASAEVEELRSQLQSEQEAHQVLPCYYACSCGKHVVAASNMRTFPPNLHCGGTHTQLLELVENILSMKHLAC